MKSHTKKSDDELEWLHHVRSMELKIIEDILHEHKNLKMLEIGGGDGYQAKILNDFGFSVISLDVEPRIPLIFPVKKIDNAKLDFPDKTFDIVFTSHVLQHVNDIEHMFNEIKRVVKNDGLVLHIVPTSGWSFVTNIWHYLFIPKYILKSFKKHVFKDSSLCSKPNMNSYNTKSYNLKKLFLHPLGISPSFIHELFYFSKNYWAKLFLRNGFEILDIRYGPYLTSGYGIFKFKMISLRKIFAKCHFTSSYCFILK